MRDLSTEEAMNLAIPLMRRDVVEAFLQRRCHPITKFPVSMIGEPGPNYHHYVERDLECTWWSIAMQRFPDLAQEIFVICPNVDLNYTEVANR